MFNQKLLHNLHLAQSLEPRKERVRELMWLCNVAISLLCIILQCAYSCIGQDNNLWNGTYFVSEYVLVLSIIFSIRDQQVMLDFHLAQVYEIETKRLNEQVKRNIKRFPETFMFQLNIHEWDILRSQFATAKRRTLPFAFTEQGVAMLSSVLNSDYAIQVMKPF